MNNSAHLFVTELAHDHVGVQLQVSNLNFLRKFFNGYLQLYWTPMSLVRQSHALGYFPSIFVKLIEEYTIDFFHNKELLKAFLPSKYLP